MTIDLPRDVSGVENLESSDLDHELSCSEDVTCVVRSEADSSREMDGLMVVDGLDGVEGVENVGFGEESVVVGVGTAGDERRRKELSSRAQIWKEEIEDSRANSNEILHDVSVDPLGSMSHVDFPRSVSEVGLRGEANRDEEGREEGGKEVSSSSFSALVQSSRPLRRDMKKLSRSMDRR